MWRCNIIFVLVTFGTIIIPHQGDGTLIPVDLHVTIFTNEVAKWVEEDVMSDTLVKMIDDLALTNGNERFDWTIMNDIKSAALCTICKSLTKVILHLNGIGTPRKVIENTIAELCTKLHIESKQVCYGVVNLNAPIILYIINNDSTINENDICSVILQEQSCVKLPKRYEWTVDIDTGPPQIINIESSNNDITLLQITDIHYDPLYEPGGNADCGEPTCCRKGQNNTSGNKKNAGYWGDYNNCDSPWHAVVDTLDHIKHHHENIDLIYFTGDIIDHGVWETTREGNIKSIIKSFDKIKDTFNDINVYPILGNHEPNPLNVFAPHDVTDDSLSTRWLYQLLADTWINYGWLPESTRDTILRGGFYTISPKSGFRVIVINNNVCYIYNWWLIYEPNDPYGQLNWLANTLLEAENNNEFVHILAHIPAGTGDCQYTWSREYKRIINRFSHIITAQFNGHTHNDEFNVFYRPDDTTEIVNVAWNGGSVTPYANLNPNYKTYLIDSSTYAVSDAITWVYNLTNANETPNQRPHWFKSYSFKNEYHLPDLSAKSLNAMIVNMAKGAPILEIYHKNFFKHAAPELEKPCDKSCLKSYLCRIVTSASGEKKDCEYFQNIH